MSAGLARLLLLCRGYSKKRQKMSEERIMTAEECFGGIESDRDHFMSAAEAKAWGVVDKVL